MTSKRSSTHLLLVCLTALGFAAACSCEQSESEKAPPVKPAEAPAAKPAPMPAASPEEPRGPAPTIREQLEAEIELPDHYPKDAPVYPGSRLSRVDWQNGGVAAIFSTGDSTENVLAFVNDNLAEQGWSEVTVSEMPDGGSVAQATKSGRSLSALVSQVEDDLTLIVISVDP